MSFPRTEWLALTAQIRRGSTSIAAKLAEGAGTASEAAWAAAVDNSFALSRQLEDHLLLANCRGYFRPATYDKLQKRVLDTQRVLASATRQLRRSTVA